MPEHMYTFVDETKLTRGFPSEFRGGAGCCPTIDANNKVEIDKGNSISYEDVPLPSTKYPHCYFPQAIQYRLFAKWH